jgi:hypothetical protein
MKSLTARAFRSIKPINDAPVCRPACMSGILGSELGSLRKEVFQQISEGRDIQ